MRPTRILVVEQQVLLAETLAVALGSHGWDVHRLTPEHADAPPSRLLACTLGIGAGIVLLDPDLGRCADGEQVLRPLTRGGIAVVALTGLEDRARWGGWLRAGARCVVSKAEPLSQLLDVLRRVELHQPVITDDQRAALTTLWDRQQREDDADRRRLSSLTPGEREVLGGLMAGLTIREVAEERVVSELTVRAQVKAVLGKLGVGNQIAAVGLAHRLDWTPPVTGCGGPPRSRPRGSAPRPLARRR